MLTIIVFYLIIFGSTDGQFSSEKCLPAGTDCLTNSDCCSEQCQSFAFTYRYCTSVPDRDTEVKCIKENEMCYNDEDCCTNICSKIGATSGYCSTVRSTSSIKRKSCIESRHFCVAHADCCSGRCSFMKSSIFLAAHACDFESDQSKLKK